MTRELHVGDKDAAASGAAGERTSSVSVDIVARFGLTPVVNAAGPTTTMGGHRLHPEVVAAMAQASSLNLPIEELEEAAGRVIARVTGAESGYVTSGAAAGLALAAAACIAGDDVELMDRLPDTTGVANEIVIQRQHRNAYDRAFRLAGARLVDVGYLGYPGAGRTRGWQVESAISERTVALAYPVLAGAGTLSLAAAVEIAHRHSLPVIVDASASLPPVGNLRRFIDEGADLVAFSGGKAIAGPQGSGILAGRADLIRSVSLQHQDMDVEGATWRRRDLVDDGVLAGVPWHGIGRQMKVGKESIVGLMVALERFVLADHRAELARQHRVLATIADAVRARSAVTPIVQPESEGARPYPILFLEFDGPSAVGRATRLANDLRAMKPPVVVYSGYVDMGRIAVIATTLAESEADVVADHLRELSDVLDGGAV